MRALVVAIVMACALGARAEVIAVKILARVAGRAISDRELKIEALMRQPKLYKQGQAPKMSVAEQEKALQRLVMELMIEEENRVVGNEKIATGDLEASYKRLREAFGSHWDEFLKEWSLSTHEIKERLSRTLLVDRSLQSRVQSTPDMSGKKNSEDHAIQVIQDWLKQLRSRYKVQFLSPPS